MQIIRDTRETKPLLFSQSYKYLQCSVDECLEVGDYAVRFSDGYIPPVRIERKSVGDLYGTLGKGYDRFKREIELANEQNLVLIIAVERPIEEIRKGIEYSKRDGESIIDQVMTLFVKYGIVHQFFTDRHEMAYYIYKLFFSIGKLYIQDKLGFKNASAKKIRELL